MIRILHINATMDLGGAETFIMNLYRNIDRSKIQFDFLLHTDKECYYNEEIRRLGGKIYSVPSRRNSLFDNKKALDNFFKEHNEYKIIHQHSSSLSYIQPLISAKKNNIPIRIIHGHNVNQSGSKIHKYIHKINQLLIDNYATDYFACSDLSAMWMYGKKKNSTYKIINNAIITDNFAFSKSIRKSIRQELNIEDKFVIGHVGRFHYQKNHEFLIDIFKEIHYKNKESVLLLVGDGSDRLKIEEKVRKLGLEECVIFLGIRDDVNKLFQAMDVFVFPSKYEGLGIVLIEAQASGIKCFTSKDVVPYSVKVTNLVEFLELNNNPKEWAKSILKDCMYNRKNTVGEIKRNKYDIREISEDLQEWYRSLI